jgi:hypothetical protein
MDEISVYFPSSYEYSRDRFRQYLPTIQRYWPNAHLDRQRLAGDENLSIDWIVGQASTYPEKILIFTTAEHGIEGFVGSAVLHYFIENYLASLNPENTALLFVHTINPWGMKHKRRTNANNVDLNRNFVWQPDDVDPTFNPRYAELNNLIEPQGPVPWVFVACLRFLFSYLRSIWQLGRETLYEVAQLGQYSHIRGIHYGGDRIQEETQVLLGLYRYAFEQADHILHLDMHTGWGPRYQMSLVNSYLESRTSAQLCQLFQYPQIVATIPEEFYVMRGDMIDYIYTLRKEEFPSKRLYATSFEFGTYGKSKAASRRGLRSMILENQFHWHGARNSKIGDWATREFLEMFYPQEKKWQTKALVDADQALRGILLAEGFIEN